MLEFDEAFGEGAAAAVMSCRAEADEHKVDEVLGQAVSEKEEHELKNVHDNKDLTVVVARALPDARVDNLVFLMADPSDEVPICPTPSVVWNRPTEHMEVVLVLNANPHHDHDPCTDFYSDYKPWCDPQTNFTDFDVRLQSN